MLVAGDIVDLNRLQAGRQRPGRYVVSDVVRGTAATGDFVTLVGRRSDGTHFSFTRSTLGLSAVPYEPFVQAELVRINSFGECGAYLGTAQGIARVLMIDWFRRLQYLPATLWDGYATRVSYWTLVYENRMEAQDA